jgi:hypothetical protein
MFDLLVFVLPLAFVFVAILLAITLLTPSWRWVASFALIVGAILAWAWASYAIAKEAPGYRVGQGEALYVLSLTIVTYAFGVAVAIYAAGLVWWKSKA